MHISQQMGGEVGIYHPMVDDATVVEPVVVTNGIDV